MFETIQNQLNEIGFAANHGPFHITHIRGVLISISAIASQIVYVLREVLSVQDYMHSIFTIIVAIAIFISFVTTIFKSKELHDFISNIRTTLTESK